jgi:hypothetical protein
MAWSGTTTFILKGTIISDTSLRILTGMPYVRQILCLIVNTTGRVALKDLEIKFVSKRIAVIWNRHKNKFRKGYISVCLVR